MTSLNENDRAFLDHVRQRLRAGAGQVAPAHPGPGVPSPDLPQVDMTTMFIREWESLGGSVMRVSSPSQIGEAVAAIARKRAAASIVRTKDARFDNAGLKVLETEDVTVTAWDTDAGRTFIQDTVASADIGLVWSDGAVAQTGSVVFSTGPGKGRSVGVMPPTLVAIVEAGNIDVTRREIFGQLGRKAGDFMPSAVNFVTGPSRTGDIENDMSTGVHGPGDVWVVLVEKK